MIRFRARNKDVDLKIPQFIKSEELIVILSEALGITISDENKLQAEPLGRILDSSKTLEQEGVTQGSTLTLI